MSFDNLVKEFGFSRATFYRYRCILRDLDAGKTIPTSSQKRYVRPKQWNKKEVAQIYSQTRSSDAEKFLEQQLRIKVLSIQVDVGSEFMKDVEKVCNVKQYII